MAPRFPSPRSSRPSAGFGVRAVVDDNGIERGRLAVRIPNGDSVLAPAGAVLSFRWAPPLALELERDGLLGRPSRDCEGRQRAQEGRASLARDLQAHEQHLPVGEAVERFGGNRRHPQSAESGCRLQSFAGSSKPGGENVGKQQRQQEQNRQDRLPAYAGAPFPQGIGKVAANMIR